MGIYMIINQNSKLKVNKIYLGVCFGFNGFSVDG